MASHDEDARVYLADALAPAAAAGDDACCLSLCRSMRFRIDERGERGVTGPEICRAAPSSSADRKGTPLLIPNEDDGGDPLAWT
jgi:hypothetical protein